MFAFAFVAVSAVVVSVVLGASVVVEVELVVGEYCLGLKFLGGLLNLGRCMEGWMTVLSSGRFGFRGAGPLYGGPGTLWVGLDGIPLGLGLAGGRLGRPRDGNLLFLLRFRMLVKTPPSWSSSSPTF